MVVFDQLPVGAAARATAAQTDVECSCVGLVPGQVYTARQLLDALLMVSGNDAATCWPTCSAAPGGVGEDERQGPAGGRPQHRAASPSGSTGPGSR